MYRAVAWAALQEGIEPTDEAAVADLAKSLGIRLVPGDGGDRLHVDGVDITGHLRDAAVENAVSLVARVPRVRAAMVSQQREMAGDGGRPIVMVGRDIGTVVLPNASVKVYLTASVGVRAERRQFELRQRGEASDLQLVTADLIRRDKMDTERADSPLRAAEDALVIETDDLGIDEVVGKLESLVAGS